MNDAFPAEKNSLASVAEHTLEEHWMFFLLEGSALLVLGTAAIALLLFASLGQAHYWVAIRGQFLWFPGAANTLVSILFGWMLMASGMIGFATTLIGRHAPGFIWSLLSSIVATAAGLFLFAWPERTMPWLTVVLTLFLALDGVVTLMMALAYRRAFHARWRLLLLSALVDLVFAAMIFFLIPRSSVLAVGAVLGIDFLFGGISVIGLSLAARTNASVAS